MGGAVLGASFFPGQCSIFVTPRSVLNYYLAYQDNHNMKTSSSIPKPVQTKCRAPLPAGPLAAPRARPGPTSGALALESSQPVATSCYKAPRPKGPKLKSQLATCGCPGKYVIIPITSRNSQLLPYLPGQPQYEDCRNSLVIAYRARQFALKPHAITACNPRTVSVSPVFERGRIS